ncbi:glycosyltransferase family 8 protein [Psittacicella gerlachiana]|uniref:Glycosyl transferase family 8 n=1 Tax=Psittacicella gerlachiana TaxID=2028574 RepID=A0A3A1YBD7_9GAMM|nr:glycosyltransferase [Psittacicella gerlachiana]RIY35603.1 hypothetical protein CKF59_03400 [Psittacicella gerlachiana]
MLKNSVYQLAFTADINTFHLIAPQLKNILAFNRSAFKVIVIHNISLEQGKNEKLGDIFTKLKDEFISYPQISFDFHYLSSEQQQAWGMPAQYTHHGIYLRLYLPRLGYQGRVLYLDLDLLCFGDLESLFSLDLQGKSLGAVTDLNNHLQRFNQKPFFDSRFSQELQEADFGNRHDYFNSGVLLIDLDALAQKAKQGGIDLWSDNLTPIFQKGVFLHDQDFLNQLHLEDRYELPVKYNYLTFFLIPQRFFLKRKGWDITKVKQPNAQQDFFSQVKIPVLLHFIGAEKPFKHSHQEFRDYYNYFAQQTINEIIARPISFYQEMVEKFFSAFGYKSACYDFSLKAIDAFGKVERKQVAKLQWQKNYNVSPALLNPYLVRCPTFHNFFTRLFASKKARLAYAQKVYQQNSDFFAQYK